MNPYKANLINSLTLIVLGTLAYFLSMTPSYTALIPVGVGVVLLLLSPGIKKHSKIQAHIAVVLTLVILIALIKPLTGAVNRGHEAAIIRVVAMMFTSLLALVYFVKSFIDARRTK